VHVHTFHAVCGSYILDKITHLANVGTCLKLYDISGNIVNLLQCWQFVRRMELVERQNLAYRKTIKAIKVQSEDSKDHVEKFSLCTIP